MGATMDYAVPHSIDVGGGIYGTRTPAYERHSINA